VSLPLFAVDPIQVREDADHAGLEVCVARKGNREIVQSEKE
jgi:hypothetical protein